MKESLGSLPIYNFLYQLNANITAITLVAVQLWLFTEICLKMTLINVARQNSKLLKNMPKCSHVGAHADILTIAGVACAV